MAMTVKKGDVVKLDDNHWSYQGNFTAGHIGVVTAIHGALDPRGGHQWVNIDDEKGAPFWIPVTTMSMVADEGTLFEDMFEDMQDGDALIAVKRNEEYNHLEAGETFTAYVNDCSCCFHFYDSDGDAQHCWDDNFYFINLSALKREYQSSAVEPSVETVPYPEGMFDPFTLDVGVERIAPLSPKYDDMDNAAKGAILLAAHEGKTVQFMSPSGGFWVDDMSFDPSENFAYRVKPQELIDAEEALNAAASNVVSLEDARDKADSEVSLAESRAEMARADWASADLEYASAKDTVEALRAA
ncbi:hypothetical protein PODOV025v1_p0020 [Vibrio phage PS32B.6]|nr:hypothetical protein PODOV025v1_p0020 [Vibrio phage PS32B.6]